MFILKQETKKRDLKTNDENVKYMQIKITQKHDKREDSHRILGILLE